MSTAYVNVGGFSPFEVFYGQRRCVEISIHGERYAFHQPAKPCSSNQYLLLPLDVLLRRLRLLPSSSLQPFPATKHVFPAFENNEKQEVIIFTIPQTPMTLIRSEGTPKYLFSAGASISNFNSLHTAAVAFLPNLKPTEILIVLPLPPLELTTYQQTTEWL